MNGRTDGYAPVVLFLLPAVAVMNIYYTQPIVGTIQTHFQVSTQSASSAFTVASLGYSVALLFYGVVAARVGAKKVMVTVSLGLGALLFIPTNDYEGFLLVRLLQGVLVAGIPAIGIAYVHKIYQRPQRLHAIFVSGLLFGAMLSRVLGGIGAYYVGVEHLTDLLIGSCVATGVAASLILKPDSVGRSNVSPLALIREARTASTLYGAVMAFLFFSAFTAIYNSIGFELKSIYQLDDFEIGLVFLVGLSGVISAQLMSHLKTSGNTHTYLTFLFLIAATGTMLTLLKSIPGILLGLIIVNFSIFGIHTLVSAHTAAFAENKEQAMSLYMMSYFLGGAAGADLATRFYQIFAWRGVVMLSVGIMAVGILVNIRGAAVLNRPGKR